MATAQTATIQALPDASKNGGMTSLVTDFWSLETARSGILAPWGSRTRERQLLDYYRHPYNTLVQGAFQGLIKKVKNTPWEITGGKTRTTYFSNLLREAQFGRGWGDFLSRVILDYLRHDVGAFIEVIAPGNPKREPTGRVLGLAHLDSMRCYLTGDPEFPVLYLAMDGKYHLLHYSRVLHLVDMPDGDEEYRDYGLCALSRAIAVVERQLLMTRYIRTKLDDLPPPGIVVGSNLNQSELQRSMRRFTEDMQQDTPPVYGRTMWLFGMNPQETAELNMVTFSQPPEGFDYEKYMGIDINQLALAIGVDRQELWELSGANIGSATQSEILHAKSQGKAYGDLLTMLERLMNRLLPMDLDFQWKVKDPQEQQNTATNAQTWVGTVRQLDGLVSPDLQLRILANQVRAVADAVIDVNGDLVRMNDVDPEAPEVEAPSSTPADDNVQNDVTNRTPGIAGTTGTKAITDVREAFEAKFDDVLANARNKVYGRVRLRSIVLNLIREYGPPAYIEGKKEGGVDEPLTEEEEAETLTLLARNREYVNAFVDTVLDVGLTDAEAKRKAEMWWNKSLNPYYDAGRRSADANGMYEWKLGRTEKHCTTCATLNGQRHRFRQYAAAGLLPKSDKLACQGVLCDCSLIRTKGQTRPRGRLPSMKEAHDHAL